MSRVLGAKFSTKYPEIASLSVKKMYFKSKSSLRVQKEKKKKNDKFYFWKRLSVGGQPKFGENERKLLAPGDEGRAGRKSRPL